MILRPVASAALFAAILTAQPAQPPRIVSPEVHPDRRVTLRLRAPNAKEVLASGEFAAKPQPMTKDPEGVWSITLGPLEPDIYGYTFRVDEVSINDPHNPVIKAGINATQSLFSVPGSSPLPWDERSVPHGTVHRHFYDSKAIGDRRSVVVYTPPGYDKDAKTRYPVLYLLHGAGDLPTSWSDTGKANFVLDNLIADRRAIPMIVVMPFGHTVTNYGRTPDGRRKNVELFAQDLLGDVIPLVESRYRVQAGQQNRAIAGLSMGGGQALWTGLANTDKFGWVAGFSSAVPEPETLKNIAEDSKRLKLLWIAIGKDDFLLDRNTKFDEWLKTQNVKYTYKVTEGAHTWRVWRRYLAELAPLLFRQS